MQINQYANEAFQINDEDFYDVDYWTGTEWQSRKISGATLKSILSTGGEWGSITGTLSDQTDLQAALDAKFNIPAGTSTQYIDGTGALQTFPEFLSSDNLIAEVYNNTGSILTKGTLVYINGGQGNLPTVTKAQANNDTNSAQTFGWVRDDIGNMSNGFIVVSGRLEDMPTNGLGNGTQLYLSPTVAGGYTTVKPQAPEHLVYVGIVVRDHPTQGVIEVKIQNGYELDELHDVLISASPNDGDILTYDSITQLWKNEAQNSTPASQTVLFADLATTEALKPCTYNNGILGVGATLTGNSNGQLSTISFADKIDNVITVLDQVILVKNQSNSIQNGLYSVTQLGDASNPFILTRVEEADTQEEMYPLQVNVFGGATQSNLIYLQKTADPIIGTNGIVFTTTTLGVTNTPVLHVDTATSSPLPSCTYTSGSNPSLPGSGAYLEATTNGALGIINGVSTFRGIRILVKDQVNTAHNGSYVVSNPGNSITKWKLTRVDTWGTNFVILQREWKVNNPSSSKYGARFSTNLPALSNTAIGTSPIIFYEIVASGLNYFIEAKNSATPNATIPVHSITPLGSETNIDISIIPKGTGAILLNIPDNTATGGNKRGTRAIDLQLTRAVSNQVASGIDSVCLGQNNIASTLYAIAIGRANNSGGNYAVCIGNSNIISGSSAVAVAIGTSNTVSNDGYALGQFNTINANDAIGLGARTTNNSVIGRLCFASGRHSVNGDAQRSVFVLRAATTGNALTTVTTNGLAASTNNQVILNNQSAYGFTGKIVGKQQGNTNAAMWKIEGLIVRGANAASTVLTVSSVTLVSNTPAWGTPTLAADTTNGGLRVQVIGATATNIQWTVDIETTESIYA